MPVVEGSGVPSDAMRGRKVETIMVAGVPVSREKRWDREKRMPTGGSRKTNEV